MENNQYMFENRVDAGRQLGNLLKQRDLEDPVVLALPRGGVIIADEVAKSMSLSMDVVIARKIGAPGHEEFGIGAISEDGKASFNPRCLNYFDIDSPEVKKIVSREQEELKRRVELYRNGHLLCDLQGKTVIVVDDGLATGVTALAAAKYLRTLDMKKIILAVPVGPRDIQESLQDEYDEIICLHQIENFQSVGQWYHQFDQVEDREVLIILNRYH